MSWIDEVVDKHRAFEAPLNFWRWAALASVSAVLKDNVYLNQQMFNLYPNIYVMFHADSGLKKGPPVNMAKRLVQSVNNTRVISGRSSIQGILKEMSVAYTRPGGEVVKDASVFICSSELSSSIVEDKVATTILTDLYDRSYNVGEWKSLLKMEVFDLKNPTVTMLTATNEAMASGFFEAKDVSGGYFARTFIIYENTENRSNSLLVPLTDGPIDYPKLAEYLKTLSKLRGEFKPLASLEEDDYCHNLIVNPYTEVKEYFSDAGMIYEHWYTDFKSQIKGTKDPTGTLNRFGTSVLKVAMLLSLAENSELIIRADSMTEAIETCTKLVGNIRKVTVGKVEQEGTNSVRATLLLKELFERENHTMSRAQLNKKFWLQGNLNEWDETVLSFEAAGIIKVIPGAVVTYVMTESSVAELTRFFSGKIEKKP